MKNKIFAVILSLTLLLPITVFAVDESYSFSDEHSAIEEYSDSTAVESQEKTALGIEQMPALPHKQPISKRTLVKKFLLAMMAVGVSSCILYYGLTIYNKMRDGNYTQVHTPEGETPLKAPGDIEDAAKIFLEKTKW